MNTYLRKKQRTKGELLVSEIWAFVVFFAALAFLMVFWLRINWWFALAFLGIFLAFCGVTLLSRKNSIRATIMMLRPFLYENMKKKVLKMAILIASPFYLCTLLLSAFPVQHYSIWFLVILPALFFFCFPLSVIAGFCKSFKVSRLLFWGLQLGINGLCIFTGRVVSSGLTSYFV